MRRGCTFRSLLNRNLPFIYDIDGNLYHYVRIDSQEWLVDNLKTTKYADGTPIPNLTLNADWIAEDGSAGHDGAYCWYNNDIANKTPYGALYNWYAVDNVHGLAPTGWRVPSDADIIALATFIGTDSIVGGKLKETGLTHWLTPNTDASDNYGFKGLPGGERTNLGAFYNITTNGRHWNTDPVDATKAYSYHLVYISAYIDKSITGYEKARGFSVRCMRDIP
jgi:uncharacterized protein (TIGR02145 family)